MLASGLSLEESMQPPQLPSPFLYRPVEDGQADPAGGIQARGVHDERTRHFMKVSCGVCAAQHWVVVRELSVGASSAPPTGSPNLFAPLIPPPPHPSQPPYLPLPPRTSSLSHPLALPLLPLPPHVTSLLPRPSAALRLCSAVPSAPAPPA